MVQMVNGLHGSSSMGIPIHRTGDPYSIHPTVVGQVVVLCDRQEKNTVSKASRQVRPPTDLLPSKEQPPSCFHFLGGLAFYSIRYPLPATTPTPKCSPMKITTVTYLKDNSWQVKLKIKLCSIQSPYAKVFTLGQLSPMEGAECGRAWQKVNTLSKLSECH